MSNYEFDIAKEYVKYTQQSLFITGKAGTGKTTFLKQVVQEVEKNFIVVAPTGVAAINAGGSTIHSMFGLPLKAFVPQNDPVDLNIANTPHSLSQHFRYRKEKRSLLQSLELLIIDEISMVRADLLDAVDCALRFVRRSAQPFGGVQLVVIGDLFQLAPVAKPNVWYQLSPYYASPYFFEANSWKQSHPIVIEFKKIYRQQNIQFIEILNRIRAGEVLSEDIEQLNLRYRAKDQTIPEQTIVLTTHNQSASTINRTQMGRLTTKSRVYKAKVQGEFSERSYPVDNDLELKVGAQVMFTRNDAEGGRYFNGKLAKVEKLENNVVTVRCEDHITVEVEPIVWENYSYKLNKETKEIEQEKIGSFAQFPLRLAWAITVHKSQGLTFEAAVLDLGQSFAFGQVYVALSRCRTLDKIWLKSKISQDNIKSDSHVMNFTRQHIWKQPYETHLAKAKQVYESERVKQLFSFSTVISELETVHSDIKKKKIEGLTPLPLRKITEDIKQLQAITIKFHRQIDYYTQHFWSTQDFIPLKNRLAQGIGYYSTEVYKNILDPLLAWYHSLDQLTTSKRTKENVIDLIKNIWDQISALYELTYINQSIYEGSKMDQPQLLQKIERLGISKKESTVDLTFKLYQQGMKIPEIAKVRNLKESTIESHIVKLCTDKKLDLFEFITKSRVVQMLPYFDTDEKDISLAKIKKEASFEVNYFELRLVRIFHQQQA